MDVRAEQGQVMGDMSREPSMEEILSSIRRVIARDDPSQKADLSRHLTPMSDEAANEDDDDDILELTQAETREAKPVSTNDQPDPADDITLLMIGNPPAAAPSTEAVAASAAAELVSPISAAASRSSLEALAAVLETGREPAVAPTAATGDLSVNALAEAALRPMLKQWLDANLPQMVERLVAKEIARITGNRL